MSIYEAKLFGNEYKANLIFAYKWHKRELVEDSERNPMHIAWRTRGDLLEVAEVTLQKKSRCKNSGIPTLED